MERRTTMFTRLFVAMLVVVLAVSISSVAFAQATKSSDKKAEVTLKSVSCDPQCGFMVQSHDEKELTDIVVAHAKSAHNMDVKAEDVKGKMKTVSAKRAKK
jgi:predicted small metal-binding protein